MGAPLEDDGESPVDVKSWQKFSRTRVSQACDSEDGVPRRTGVRMGEPPRPPPIWLPSRRRQASVGKSEVPKQVLVAYNFNISWFWGKRAAQARRQSAWRRQTAKTAN